MIVNRTAKHFFTAFWFLLALPGTSVTPVQAANKCAAIDREQSIQSVMAGNPGAKILKVIERENNNGCKVLVIRILIDGTVKAIKIKGKGN